MQIRGRSEQQKIEPAMAPMIDVVFQLLIFFMLTLKIIEPEGDFSINMPIGVPATADPDQPILPDLKVRLVANPDGTLASLRFGPNDLGTGQGAFRQLNNEILNIIGQPGNPLTKDMEVEIDADYNLNFQYIISAVGACTGRLDSSGKKVVRYVEKIKFAPPRRPASSGS